MMNLSYLGFVLITICLISIASLTFLSSPQNIFTGVREHVLRGPHINLDANYKELSEYVKRLEDIVEQKKNPETHEINSLTQADHVSHIEDHLGSLTPPKYQPTTNNNNYEKKTINNITPVSNVDSNFDDNITNQWLSILSAKLKCLRVQSGSIYLYHTRKAAGTSIRDILMYISSVWNVPYLETEGIILNKDILKKTGILTITSLREPVSRILSLYWYEHVGWYDGILKQTDRCKTLKQWITAWRDGSKWKTDFINKNPNSVYVEMENYYIKMLIGWKPKNRQSRINRQDLEEAKLVLRSFDLVLLSDWMGDNTQIEAMNAIFPGILYGFLMFFCIVYLGFISLIDIYVQYIIY